MTPRSIPSNRTYDVLAVGRSCIDLYAHEVGVPIGEVKSFDAYVGGTPTNVSVGTRRLGLRSALLTAVGDDDVADFVLHFLRNEGVETRFIPTKIGCRTSAVIMTIQPPDRFPLTFYRDNCADNALTVEDVERAPLADSRIVLLTGTALAHEPGRSATMFAAEQARQTGAFLLVDIDYRPVLWTSRASFGASVRSLVSLADMAVATEEETMAAADIDDPEGAVAAVLATGVPELVLKQGARGATLYRSDEPPLHVPTFPVNVLNVLGAGDAFASGLIYGCLQGWTRERAIRMGNATGAIVVTRHGCANFMPTLSEVETFLASCATCV